MFPHDVDVIDEKVFRPTLSIFRTIVNGGLAKVLRSYVSWSGEAFQVEKERGAGQIK